MKNVQVTFLLVFLASFSASASDGNGSSGGGIPTRDLTKVAVVLRDSADAQTPIVQCAVDAALKAAFADERTVVQYSRLAQVGKDATPEVISIVFVAQDQTGNRVTHQVRLTTTDPVNKWQHIDIPSAAPAFYSRSVSPTARIYNEEGSQELTSFDISFCQ